LEARDVGKGDLQPCPSKGMFQALALAGGGYRGLFAARALQVIEDHIQAPIATRFDLVTGTSIGGIIALAAAYEVPISHVVSTFERYGEDIFRVVRRARAWMKPLDGLRGVFSARYSVSALRSAITEILPDDITLSAAKHAVAIPAVNMTQGRPQVFKSPYHPDWAKDRKYRAVDVALATSAAPTYFELAQLDGSLYADGGLFANAPDLIAIHEAERFLGFSIESIRGDTIGHPSTCLSGLMDVQSIAVNDLRPSLPRQTWPVYVRRRPVRRIRANSLELEELVKHATAAGSFVPTSPDIRCGDSYCMCVTATATRPRLKVGTILQEQLNSPMHMQFGIKMVQVNFDRVLGDAK
jgi:predicted acylesterase/phospholipase RssA